MIPECDCKLHDRINFLDTEFRPEEGKLVTDLYRKPTVRNQNLLLSSFHPPHSTVNISVLVVVVLYCSYRSRKNYFSFCDFLALSNLLQF